MAKITKLVLIFVVTIGLFFRFYHLDHKIYWHDEVYTIFRSGGFTRAEIDRELFDGDIKSPSDLVKYLSIKPASSVKDTIDSLAVEDPQHPPLYFILTRYWMKLFSNSRLAIRSLSVLVSVISLPIIYLLTTELFRDNPHSKLLGLTTAALLALSPVDILFAQTARQYSSLTLCTILSAYCLTKALKTDRVLYWVCFSIAVALSCYIHPFFVLTLIAFAVYLGLFLRAKFFAFILYSALGLAIYSPWIVVLISNFQRTLATTSWATIDVGFDYLAKLWVLSFTSLFFDLDVGFNNLLTYIMRLPFVVLILLSVIYLVKDKSIKTTGFFLITSAFIPFLILVSADLMLGGKRSAVTRYLIGCFPFVQIMSAYLIFRIFSWKKMIGTFIITIVTIASLSSIFVSSQAKTWWNKDLSYNNATIIQTINDAQRPIVVSDLGDNFTNTGDLIGMAIDFKSDVRLLLVPMKSSLKETLESFQTNGELFFFRPSQQLLEQIKSISSPSKIWW